MASTKVQLLPPVVAADRSIAELTVKALILGAILSMVLAAANAYIGLLVGNLLNIPSLSPPKPLVLSAPIFIRSMPPCINP